jgi:hypothetical protein
MNYTKIVFIALALCLCLVLPVSAEHVWNNDNFVDADELAGYTIVHDPVTGVDSKYVATSPFDAVQPVDTMTGTIHVNVRSGYNTLTQEIGIRNDAIQDAPNASFAFYPILPDGTAELQVVPGQFTLYIPNSNGGQDEFAPATVAAGKITYVAMLGHAGSGYSEIESTPEQPQCVQKIKDVTCKVDSLIRWDNWRQFLHIDSDYDNLHYNALFGDPDVGTLKELRVVYKYEKWGWSRVLVIKSAQYGTFCGETKVPKGYTLKSVAEDVDMDIHYSTST